MTSYFSLPMHVNDPFLLQWIVEWSLFWIYFENILYLSIFLVRYSGHLQWFMNLRELARFTKPNCKPCYKNTMQKDVRQQHPKGPNKSRSATQSEKLFSPVMHLDGEGVVLVVGQYSSAEMEKLVALSDEVETTGSQSFWEVRCVRKASQGRCDGMGNVVYIRRRRRRRWRSEESTVGKGKTASE